MAISSPRRTRLIDPWIAHKNRTSLKSTGARALITTGDIEALSGRNGSSAMESTAPSPPPGDGCAIAPSSEAVVGTVARFARCSLAEAHVDVVRR